MAVLAANPKDRAASWKHSKLEEAIRENGERHTDTIELRLALLDINSRSSPEIEAERAAQQHELNEAVEAHLEKRDR